MKFLFWLRKNQTNEKGEAPLVLRITVRGARCEYYTGLVVPVQFWDRRQGSVKGNGDNVLFINESINDLKNRVYEIWRSAEKRSKHISAYEIVQALKGKDYSTAKVSEAIELYLSTHNIASLADSTKNTYHSYYSSLVSYLQEIKQPDIMLIDFSKELAKKFTSQRAKSLQPRSYNTSLRFYETCFKYFVKQSWIDENPFADIDRMKVKKNELHYLDELELNLLNELVLEGEWFDNARDLFLLQCYTGLSFIDLYNLGVDDVFDWNGRTWLEKDRQKTHVQFSLPLRPEAVRILKKYGGVAGLPKLEYRTYLNYVRKLGKLIDWEDNLTTHVGRKTFAVMALNFWGCSIDVVSKMLGHKYIQTTQEYYLTSLRDLVGKGVDW